MKDDTENSETAISRRDALKGGSAVAATALLSKYVSDPAKAQSTEPRLQLGPDWAIDDDGDGNGNNDLRITHQPTDAELRYDVSESAWIPTDGIGTSSDPVPGTSYYENISVTQQQFAASGGTETKELVYSGPIDSDSSTVFDDSVSSLSAADELIIKAEISGHGSGSAGSVFVQFGDGSSNYRYRTKSQTGFNFYDAKTEFEDRLFDRHSAIMKYHVSSGNPDTSPAGQTNPDIYKIGGGDPQREQLECGYVNNGFSVSKVRVFTGFNATGQLRVKSVDG